MNNPNAKDVLGTSVEDYARRFSAASGQPSGANFFDQFDTPQQFSAPLPDGRNFRQAREGGEQPSLAEIRGRQTSAPTQMALEHMNVAPAAMQGTAPRLDGRQLISTELFQSDSGDVLFRDPNTNQVIPTDNSKHVVLTDPADGRMKVYSRTPDTNESGVVGGARVLASGLVAGAPAIRPAAVAPAVVAARPGEQVAAAAQRIGVEVPRAVTTDSMAVQRTAATTKNIPLAGDPLVKAADKTVLQLGQKAADVAQSYGSGSLTGGGEAARGAITEYITGTTAQRASKLYDKVDELVNPSVTRPLVQTQRVVADIQGQRGLAGLPEGKAVSQLSEALARPEGLTYEGTKTLRTYVGEQVKTGILPEGMSAKDMDRIYGALSQDLQGVTLAAGGPRAAAAFERANRYYALVSQRRAELAKIVGAQGNAPAEQVFDRLLSKAGSSTRADIEVLSKARKAIGAEDWNEFVSGVIARMGRDPSSYTGPEALQAANFSPQRFLTAYDKLTPAGKDILFRSGGKAGPANALADIAKVSTRFKELQKFSNPSGTSQSLFGGGIAAGLLAEPITTITAVVGGRAMASILAKPATAASVAHWARTYEGFARAPSVQRAAMLEIASRNLANTLRDSGINVSGQDFLRAIQGPMKSAADGENPEPERVVNQ